MILNIIIDIFIDVVCVNLMVMYFLIESAVLCLGPPAKRIFKNIYGYLFKYNSSGSKYAQS